MKVRLFVKPDSDVEFRQRIFGKAKKTVQLYVLSNDGLYYLQNAPIKFKRHNTFAVDCVFGATEELDIERGYEIIAVESEDRPKSPVKELPKNVKASVRVWRRK